MIEMELRLTQGQLGFTDRGLKTDYVPETAFFRGGRHLYALYILDLFELVPIRLSSHPHAMCNTQYTISECRDYVEYITI